MTTQSLKGAIDELNRVSIERWGDDAPRYSYMMRGPSSSRIYYVHRVRPNISPFLPADELWARGRKDHVLAKVRSSIQYATHV